MKKKTVVIMFAILLMSAFSLQAGIRIGAKASVNLANASFSADAIRMNNFTGFQVGPIIELSSLTGIGFDAAVLYSQQGVKFNGTSITAADYSVKTNTLDVPVNLKMKFSLIKEFGLYFTAGPYVSFKLDNQGTLSLDKVVINEWINKQFGVGFNFGAGFELVKHLQLGVNYQLALNDDYSSNDSIVDYAGQIIQPGVNGKTRIWSITLAFFF